MYTDTRNMLPATAATCQTEPMSSRTIEGALEYIGNESAQTDAILTNLLEKLKGPACEVPCGDTLGRCGVVGQAYDLGDRAERIRLLACEIANLI